MSNKVDDDCFGVEEDASIFFFKDGSSLLLSPCDVLGGVVCSDAVLVVLLDMLLVFAYAFCVLDVFWCTTLDAPTRNALVCALDKNQYLCFFLFEHYVLTNYMYSIV